MRNTDLWRRYKRYLCVTPRVGLRVDISRMMFDDTYLEKMSEPMAAALDAMERLERGAIANVDEDRMVGHYWLRAAHLAPDPAIAEGISGTIEAIKGFVERIHASTINPQRGDGFYVVLLIGVGGSALGPQFVAEALATSDDPMIIRFIDNTDPDGIDRTLADLDEALAQTLTVVVSKSGSTIETRNGMLEVAAAYRRAGLDFAKHAVAVTTEGSQLHRLAVNERWLAVFPMWDWVGGRTSEFSAVGLLPAALQGIDVDAMLAGAGDCDADTRERDWCRHNPAALLAAMWYYVVTVRGRRNMVVLPYRDRLSLLGRYLQQLVMESIGKERDRSGKVVQQGLTVYGNKGTTDQHSFLQQLRDGLNDFFVTFVDVLKDREGESISVGPNASLPAACRGDAADAITAADQITSGDYLRGFLHGTREALYENGRESITITLEELSPRTLGALIALFERAVGLYAELINVNAYNQPGVEAGKKAAGRQLELQGEVLAHLDACRGSRLTIEEIACAIGVAEGAEAGVDTTSCGAHAEATANSGDVESIFHILEHAVANPDSGIVRQEGTDPFTARYGYA
ncbi:MAG: glucose-6-phosphate isomerase [Phycisphaerae bacterium]